LVVVTGNLVTIWVILSLNQCLKKEICSNLKPVRQCQHAYAMVSKALGLIARTHYKNQDILLKLYKTVVRPHLEYSISVWSPYYEKDKILLDGVQHRFTRLIPGFKQLTYMEQLRRLWLWTLEERRNRADLQEFFWIFRGQSLMSFTDLFTISTVTNTRGHSAKITKHRCHLDLL